MRGKLLESRKLKVNPKTLFVSGTVVGQEIKEKEIWNGGKDAKWEDHKRVEARQEYPDS